MAPMLPLPLKSPGSSSGRVDAASVASASPMATPSDTAPASEDTQTEYYLLSPRARIESPTKPCSSAGRSSGHQSGQAARKGVVQQLRQKHEECRARLFVFQKDATDDRHAFGGGKDTVGRGNHSVAGKFTIPKSPKLSTARRADSRDGRSATPRRARSLSAQPPTGTGCCTSGELPKRQRSSSARRPSLTVPRGPRLTTEARSESRSRNVVGQRASTSRCSSSASRQATPRQRHPNMHDQVDHVRSCSREGHGPAAKTAPHRVCGGGVQLRTPCGADLHVPTQPKPMTTPHVSSKCSQAIQPVRRRLNFQESCEQVSPENGVNKSPAENKPSAGDNLNKIPLRTTKSLPHVTVPQGPRLATEDRCVSRRAKAEDFVNAISGLAPDRLSRSVGDAVRSSSVDPRACRTRGPSLERSKGESPSYTVPTARSLALPTEPTAPEFFTEQRSRSVRVRSTSTGSEQRTHIGTTRSLAPPTVPRGPHFATEERTRRVRSNSVDSVGRHLGVNRSTAPRGSAFVTEQRSRRVRSNSVDSENRAAIGAERSACSAHSVRRLGNGTPVTRPVAKTPRERSGLTVPTVPMRLCTRPALQELESVIPRSARSENSNAVAGSPELKSRAEFARQQVLQASAREQALARERLCVFRRSVAAGHAPCAAG